MLLCDEVNLVTWSPPQKPQLLLAIQALSSHGTPSPGTNTYGNGVTTCVFFLRPTCIALGILSFLKRIQSYLYSGRMSFFFANNVAASQELPTDRFVEISAAPSRFFYKIVIRSTFTCGNLLCGVAALILNCERENRNFFH